MIVVRGPPNRIGGLPDCRHRTGVPGRRESRRWRIAPFGLPRRGANPQGGGVKTIAILGASNQRTKFGNRAVRAFAAKGWRVFPVNPRETVIEGLPVFASIADVPVRPDLISVYLPPEVLVQELPRIAGKGCDELWLNPGADSPEAVEAAERLGLNVVQACSLVGHGLDPGD